MCVCSLFLARSLSTNSLRVRRSTASFAPRAEPKKGGILYSRCHSSETRHLARQVGGASADFFFIDLEFIIKIFVRLSVKHASKKEA